MSDSEYSDAHYAIFNIDAADEHFDVCTLVQKLFLKVNNPQRIDGDLSYDNGISHR